MRCGCWGVCKYNSEGYLGYQANTKYNALECLPGCQIIATFDSEKPKMTKAYVKLSVLNPQ